MREQRGLIRLIVLIIVAILLLSYFRFDLRTFVQSDQVQQNFAYVWELLKGLWAKLTSFI